jgi:ABC-type glycerol-3-phosphate transport system substrate-binding protein
VAITVSEAKEKTMRVAAARPRLTRSRFLKLGAGAAAPAVLAACGRGAAGTGPQTATQAPVTIEWFNAGDTVDEGRERLIARFREQHPHVVPQVSLGGANNNDGYRAKLKTLFASDTAPDVFYLEWFVYPPYVVAGSLAELDSLARRDKVPVDDLWPSFRKQFTYKGKLWAFTQGMQTMVTWYNVDLLQQAGLQAPGKGTTWAQYLDLAQKLTVRQGSEIQRFGTTFWRSLHQPPGAFMFMAGGRMFDRGEDPQASTFHEAPEQEALLYLSDLVNKHRVAPTGPEESALGGNDAAFASGKAVLNMRNVPITTWETRMKDYRWAAAPLPAGKAGQFSVANGHGQCMAAATKKRDAAWTFLGWYGGVEGQTATAREQNAIPGLRAVAQKAYLAEPRYAAIKAVVLDSLEHGRYFPNTTRTNEALLVINPTMGQVFNGQLTAREAGEKLRKEVDAILRGG